MGVRHLETFCCNDVPNGFLKVDIQRELRKSTSKIIVIDLMSLYSLFNSNKEDLLCGGRFKVVLDQAEALFSKLKDAGAELVFFYDGPLQTVKYDTWTDRQDQKYRQCISIMDDISGGCLNLKAIIQRQRQLPNITGYAIKRVAKKYGDFHISVDAECDLEIAAYAVKHNALAVITNDSDFLIYRGEWRYWSSKHLDVNTLSTMEYNRKAFIQKIGLSYDQLPLLATLGGNDIIKYDEVQNFHRQLGNYKHKFQNIASYIKINSSTELNDDILTRIMGHVFPRNLRPLQRFKESLEVYNINYKASDLNSQRDPIIDMLLKRENSFGYQIYTERILNITSLFFDFRKTDMGNVFCLIIPIVAKQAGVILYNRQHICNTFKVYTKKFHQSSHQLFKINAVFPDNFSIPPLLDLNSEDVAMKNSLHDRKLNILCWTVSDNLILNERIRSLPKEYLAVALALYRLVEQNSFTMQEADLMMLSIHHVITNRVATDLIHPEYLKIRALRLVFLYQKLETHVCRSVNTVGLLDFSTPSNLDGVYFHILYNQFVALNDARRKEFTAQIQPFRLHDF